MDTGDVGAETLKGESIPWLQSTQRMIFGNIIQIECTTHGGSLMDIVVLDDRSHSMRPVLECLFHETIHAFKLEQIPVSNEAMRNYFVKDMTDVMTGECGFRRRDVSKSVYHKAYVPCF